MLQDFRGALGKRSHGRQRPDPFLHPLLHERFGGFPKVELRIQLPAQTLDVQEGLLKQYQLRLDFHVELCRGAEQFDQEVAERNLVQRFGEDGVADFPDDPLELGFVRRRRYPPRFQMQLCDLSVVAVEESHQVAGKVVLVALRQGTDDGAIERDVLRIFRVFDVDEDVARMHVGMKEIVDEHLLEKSLDASIGQELHVRPARFERGDVADGDARYTFEHQHVGSRQLVMDSRHVQQH